VNTGVLGHFVPRQVQRNQSLIGAGKTAGANRWQWRRSSLSHANAKRYGRQTELDCGTRECHANINKCRRQRRTTIERRIEVLPSLSICISATQVGYRAVKTFSNTHYRQEPYAVGPAAKPNRGTSNG